MIYYDGKSFNDSSWYEIYILKKFLSKHYGENNAMKLLKASSIDLDSLAVALGEKDIAFFCLYFMSDTFVVKDTNEARELSESHYELWEIANETFIKNIYDKLNIICPRGWAKTTIFDLAVSVWLICYKKSKFTLLGAKKDDDAIQFLDSIKKTFKENDKIIKCFGYLIDPNRKDLKVNANEIEFTNNVYIRAVGSASSVRGANWKGIRPTVVICDDYQDEKDILTDEAKEKKYNRWTKEIEQVGDKAVYRNGKKIKSATKIISIGTVLSNDCLVSRLSRNKDYKTIIKRAILLAPEETVEDIFEAPLWVECKKIYYNDKDSNSRITAENFYKQHKKEMQFKVLWPEKWDCFTDLAIPYWENRTSFMSELMNDATAIGEKWFKSIRTETKEYIENNDFTKTALVVDPASTTNKKSDYTTILVASETANNFLWIRKLLMQKLEFDEYCLSVVKTLKEYKDITHIIIEKNTYQGADVLKIKELIASDKELNNRGFVFINKMQRINKDEKISTVIDPINNGQIIFIDDNKEAIKQILDFQGQRYTQHDDAVDCVAEAYLKMKEIQNNRVKLLDRRLLGI